MYMQSISVCFTSSHHFEKFSLVIIDSSFDSEEGVQPFRYVALFSHFTKFLHFTPGSHIDWSFPLHSISSFPFYFLLTEFKGKTTRVL